MIRVYKSEEVTNPETGKVEYANETLVKEMEDTSTNRVAAARMVGKEHGGLRYRSGEWRKGAWRVTRDVGECRVYKYGLLPPTANAELVEEQLLLGHRFQNKVVEIERGRREAEEAALAAIPDVAEWRAEVAQREKTLEEARVALKRENQRTRSRSVLPAEKERVRDLAAELKAAMKELRRAEREARKDPGIKAATEEIRAGVKATLSEARAESGAYWGTYNLAHEAAQQSFKAAAKWAKEMGRPIPMPRFTALRERRTMRVGVQIQGGMRTEDVFGDDSRLQIDPVPPEAWDGPRSQRRRLSRTCVRLRICSDKRDPVFAEWPMVMHRPLPPGEIMGAVVTKRRVDCRRWRWDLCVTVRMDPVEHVRREGTVEIETGVLRDGDQLVVGHYVCSDGRHGSIVLDPTVERDLEKAEELRSLRDRLKNEMAALVVPWVQSRTLPEELNVATIHAWCASERFARLAMEWRHARFPGDEECFEILEAWRYRNEHLERMESGLRRKAQLRRREQYRCLAASLAERYGEVRMPKKERATKRRAPAPESDDAKMTALRRAENLVAVYSLEECLRNAFRSRGGKVTER